MKVTVMTGDEQILTLDVDPDESVSPPAPPSISVSISIYIYWLRLLCFADFGDESAMRAGNLELGGSKARFN